MSTKLRALYQRRKGRDLFDLWLVLTGGEVTLAEIVGGLEHYMQKDVFTYPQLRLNRLGSWPTRTSAPISRAWSSSFQRVTTSMLPPTRSWSESAPCSATRRHSSTSLTAGGESGTEVVETDSAPTLAPAGLGRPRVPGCEKLRSCASPSVRLMPTEPCGPRLHSAGSPATQRNSRGGGSERTRLPRSRRRAARP